MPSPSVIKRTIRNQRGAKHPRTPDDIRDLVISGDWATTGGTTPEQFLAYDNGPEAESRVIVFATTDCLRHLGGSQRWQMDGNFAIAPKLFKQVYIYFGIT